MSAQYGIKIEVDDAQANAAVAALEARIRGIGGAASGSASPVHNLQSQLNGLASTNPGLGQIIQNLQGVGGAASAASSGAGGLGGAFGGLGNAASSALNGLQGLSGGLGGIASLAPVAALGATAVGGALVALGKSAVEASAKFEAYKASLTTVMGSSEKAAASFDMLTKFAAKTPFSLDQAVEGFIKLKALGLQPSEAALTSYGNTASAMGKDLNQMVEAVADAATGEFERLKEFGIKAKVQGDQVALTFAGVTTKVGNNSKEIQGYLMALGDTKFAGAMEKQSTTFNGIMSNLQDTIEQTFAAVGDAGLLDAMKRMVSMLTTGIAAAKPILTGIGSVLGGIVDIVSGVASAIGSMFFALQGGGTQSLSLIDLLGGALKFIGDTMSVTGQVFSGVFSVVGSTLSSIIGGIQSAFSGLFGSITDGGKQSSDTLTISFGQLYEGLKSTALDIPKYFQEGVDYLKGVGSDLISSFSGVGDGIKGTLGGIGEWLYGIFKGPIDTIAGWWKSMFGDLDFSLAGFLIGAARVVDGVIGVFRGGANVIGVLWRELPGVIWQSFPSFFQSILTGMKNLIVGIASGVSSVFNAIVSFGSSVVSTVVSIYNSVASFIATVINKIIDGLNYAIKGANALGAGITPIGHMVATATAPPAANTSGWGKLGKDLGGAFSAGFGNEAETATRGFIKRFGGNTNTGGGGGTDTGGDGASPGSGKKGKGDKDDAASKAAERLKKENEFFEKLKQEADVAGMLPLEAERYNKQVELRKILGDGVLKNARDLLPAELALIDAELKRKAIGEMTKAIGLQQRAADIENVHLKERAALIGKGTLDQQTEALAIEEKLWPLKQAQLEKGLSLDDEAFKKQLAIVEARERENYQLGLRNKLLQDGISSAAQYAKSAFGDTPQGRVANATKTRDDLIRNLTLARDAGAISPAEFAAGVKKAGKDFDAAVGKTGDTFATKLGSVLKDFASAIGGKLGDLIGKIGSIADGIGGFGKTQGDWANKITGLFGGDAASPLVKGIGKAVGGAMAGLQIGESIGKLASAVGIRGAETGAKIGGAIGGLTGNPLIAAGASVIGGLIGALFFKPKQANAGFARNADGTIGVGSVTGNSSQLKSAASGDAAAVLQGLNQLASQLGGTLTGVPHVTIGTFDGKYRVDTQGRTGSMDSKHMPGVTDFGKDGQAAAIQFAIETAIKQGVITGLPEVVQKALNVLSTDSAVAFAQQWADVADKYADLTDPVANAIKKVTKPLDDLRDTMIKVGASTEDLNKLDKVRASELDKLMKASVKSLTDFKDALNGEGTGVTALNRLNADLEKFNAFKNDVAAGKQINQDDFTALGSKIMSEASAVYGTSTSQFQDIRGMLLDVTTGAITNVQNAANDATVVAITQTTNAINQVADQTAIGNEYLAQIADSLANLGYANNNNYLNEYVVMTSKRDGQI